MNELFRKIISREIQASDRLDIKEMKKIVNFFQYAAIPFYGFFTVFYIIESLYFLLSINLISLFFVLITISNRGILKSYLTKRIFILSSLNLLFIATSMTTATSGSVEYYYFWTSAASLTYFTRHEKSSKIIFVIIPLVSSIYFKYFYTVPESLAMNLSPIQQSIFDGICFFSVFFLVSILITHLKHVLRTSLHELDHEKSLIVQNKNDIAIGKIACSVAHEINTPLAILKMSTDSLNLKLKNILPNENEYSLIFARLDTHRKMNTRISRIVEALRVYAGEKSSAISAKKLSLAELIRTSTSLYFTKIREAGIIFEVNFESKEIEEFEIKAQEILYAIGQLVFNAFEAIEHTQNGHIKIYISFQGDKINFSIEDSGKITDPEIIEKLFTPFHTTKNFQHHLGIGLSTARSMLRQINGEISFVAVHPNSKFVIEVPKVYTQA